jgi:RNA polymerase-binding transcription factor
MPDLGKLKEKLTERLRELGVRVHDIEEDLRSPMNPDFAEQATEEEGSEVLKELETNALHEAEQIQAALLRMDAGSYGECAGCGENISPARLDALPYATTCIKCAE